PVRSVFFAPLASTWARRSRYWRSPGAVVWRAVIWRASYGNVGKQLSRALEPVFGFLGQQPVDDGLVTGELARQLRNRPVHVLIYEPGGVFGFEHAPAGKHLDENHAQTIQVGTRVHRLAHELLGAHVARGREQAPVRSQA